jgi:hypothetical protein
LTGTGASLAFGDGARKLGQTRIKKTGTYYVTVTAKSTPAEGASYTLSLKR